MFFERARRDLARLVMISFASAAALMTVASPAQAEVNRIKSNPSAIILDGVRVGEGVEYYFLSGQLPSPVDPNKPMSEVTSLEEMGDTKTQTISTLNRIKALLEAQGYSMADLVKLSLFVAADPRTGQMDFAGANEGFKQFFGTAENPTTVARSTFQVAGLVGPHYLIEIEAIAVRKVDREAASLSYQRPHRLPPALRKKSLLAHNTDRDSRRG